jgi:ferredoxin
MKEYRIRVADCDPGLCGFSCQEVCPQGVFLSVPRDRKLERHAAQPRYRVVPRVSHFCDGCGECVAACPQEVIRVLSRKTGEEINEPVSQL